MVVYPRWRGELDRTASVVSSGSGLSPLARGTQRQVVAALRGRRFIPLARGTLLMVSFYSWRTGLSPLARGTRQAAPSGGRGSRFIPAGAGNTAPISGANPTNTVYPRWRGEHSKHNLLLINDFLSQSQSTNFIVSHKQHIHYVKEHLIH